MSEDLGYQRRWYCTYFDVAYAARARLMLQSLRAAGDEAPVVAVCFDAGAAEAVGDLAGVTVVALAQLEARYPQLLTARTGRTRAEYLFTTTPFTILHTLDLADAQAWVTYLDADLWFLDNPQAIYEEIAEADVGLIRHDYQPSHRGLERYGIYNVGWVSIRNCAPGRKAARWWAQECVSWCLDRVDGLRYADQGYLTSFPQLFPGVVEITHRGANLAPWNLRTRPVRLGPDGRLMADEQPVLFFHAHGLRKHGDRYVTADRRFGTKANAAVREFIYQPYIRALEAATSGVPAHPARRGRGPRGAAARARMRAYYLMCLLRNESFPA